MDTNGDGISEGVVNGSQVEPLLANGAFITPPDNQEFVRHRAGPPEEYELVRSAITQAHISNGDEATTTIFIGEKHVQFSEEGKVSGGDGSVYNGDHPDSFCRGGGVGRELGRTNQEPHNSNFGSAHPSLCQFLMGDAGVRKVSVDINPQIFGLLTRRNDKLRPLSDWNEDDIKLVPPDTLF